MSNEKPAVEAKGFRRGVDWLLMILAIATMTWSQFELYISDVNFVTATEITRLSAGLSGWDAHPHAGPILFVLALVFLTDVHREPLMRSWGWVVVVPLLASCLFPLAFGYATNGIDIGQWAVGFSVAAVLAHWVLPDWPFAKKNAEVLPGK